MGTRVTLYTERPGLVIGRKGDSIKALTDAIQFDFGFDKPQVEVVEVENPNLNAQIMSEKLASALERGWHFRRAGHSTVRRIMDNGARGCQVIISGKLTGQRHRTEKFKEGHIKFCGEPKLQWMEEGFTPAKLKPGIIGVKVQIMHPKARLPDEVRIRDAVAEDAPIPAAPEPAEPTQAAPAQPAESEKPAPRKKRSEETASAAPVKTVPEQAEKPVPKKKAEEAPAVPAKPEPVKPAQSERPVSVKKAGEPAKPAEQAKPAPAAKEPVQQAAAPVQPEKPEAKKPEAEKPKEGADDSAKAE